MIRSQIANIPESGIRKYFDMLNEMDQVISLGIGEPNFVTPDRIMRAAKEAMELGQTHYSSNMGMLALRKQIAHYMQDRFSLEYAPNTEIMLTVGASEAIDLALRCLVGPGDEVVIPEPSFVAYKGCTLFTGATPVPVKLKEREQFKLCPEALEAALSSNTRVVIFPFPNNPTGSVMRRCDMAPIVDVLKKRDITILSDEIYAELTYHGTHESIASFREIKDRTIVINGFSKAFAMTGWRLGYVCARSELIEAMNKIHQYSIMCAPSLAQYAALEALKNGREEVDYMTARYNERKRLMVHGFRSIGLPCCEPEGAFYAFPNISGTGLRSDTFCERLLMEERVLVVPGDAFGACGEGYVRATYASDHKKIITALERIGAFVKRWESECASN